MKILPPIAIVSTLVWAGAVWPQATLPSCGPFPAGADSLVCECEAGFTPGGVWGTNIYTVDSDICAAAQQAGAITAQGGRVKAVATVGQEEYIASTKNGITSQRWGKWDRSIMFVNPDLVIGVAANGNTPPEACTALSVGSDRVTCSCSASAATTAGGVWGSDPFTADSNICSAARFAGIIGANGGTVTALRGPGVPNYRGSTANGVTSFDWQNFDSSLIFDRNQPRP